MKKLFLTLIISILLLELSSAVVISDCNATAINTPGYYELNQSITSVNTCLTIATSNVEIDCKGHTIEYANTGTATRFGVDVVYGTLALNNITIRNCNIQKPSNLNTAGYGIRMQRTSNSFIVNNTIRTNGTTNNHGIYLLTGCNLNVIENNTIIASGSSTGSIGIYAVYDSNNNTFTGNNITTYGTTTNYALFLSTDSNDNIIQNNNLSSTTTSVSGNTDVHTAYVFSSKRNDFINNDIYSQGFTRNYAVHMSTNANSNLISGNRININGLGTTNYGVYVLNSRLNLITNNNITTNGTTTNHGVVFSGSYLSNVTENKILARGTSTGNFGMYLAYSEYLNIEKNFISTSGTTTGYGISLLTSNQLKIANNTINTTGSAGTNTGILVTTSIYNSIEENNISTMGTTANAGIFLTTTSNENIIKNNNILARGTTTLNYGLYATQSQFNEIIGNNITSIGGGATNYGVHFITQANRNILTNNVIYTYGTTSNHGIFLSTASYNTFTGNNITANGSTKGIASTNYGIYLTTVSNENFFYNGTVTTDGGGTNYAVYLLTDSDRNLIKNHVLSAGGDFSLNQGVFLSSSDENVIEESVISTSGTTTNYGVQILASSNKNNIKNNNISTSGSTPSTSYAFYIRETAPNKPSENNITNNNLVSIEGVDLYFYDAAINNNSLVNQIINGYTFRVAAGDHFNIKSDFGEINFLEQLTTSSTGLSNKVYVTDNFAAIEETIGLNKSAEIILYNLPTSSTELNIYRNGDICTPEICTNLTSMQAGNVRFNVTGGGNYTILATSLSPKIELNLPEDDFSTNQQNIHFNFTAIDDSLGDLNCSIYLNSNLNQTNPSTQNNTLTDFEVNGLAEGNYNWYIECFDSSGNRNISESRNLSINISQPSIILNYPLNNYYFNDITSVTLNLTSIDNNLRETTIWIYGDGVLLNTSTNVLNGTTLTYEWEGLDLGEHNWTVISNNGVYNSTEEIQFFNLVNLTLELVAGGPYQSGGIVLVQGEIIDNSGLDVLNQSINLSVYNSTNDLVVNTDITTGSNGLFNRILSGLGVDNYTVNVTIDYEGISVSNSDSFIISLSYTEGYNAGFIAGNESGFIEGFNQGNITGFNLGNISGFYFGNLTGYQTGFIAGNESGFTEGYSLGNTTGFILGNESGFILGNATGFYYGNISGFILGNQSGFIEGNLSGYLLGNSTGYQTGFTIGNLTGFMEGNLSGFYFGNISGYNEGYNIGFIAGSNNSASFVLDKIASLYELTNDSIIYNITLRVINKGGNASSVFLTDEDSDLSPYDLGNISSGGVVERSYLKSFERNSTTYYYLFDQANVSGIDSSSGGEVEANSNGLNLTIPSKSVNQQLSLVKNIYYKSENSTSVNYTVSFEVINSGGVDLTGILINDQDLELSTSISLNRSQAYNYSNSLIINKAASNLEYDFYKTTATVNSVQYDSNKINIIIPGYGGPADTIVYAPSSVNLSTSFDTTINIINQNPDIGQNFIADYWITNVAETINYSAGQQTIYVPALGSTNLTATLTSPNLLGNYRFRALVSYIGGPDTAFDTFVVSNTSEVEEESGDNEGDGVSGGGGGVSSGRSKFDADFTKSIQFTFSVKEGTTKIFTFDGVSNHSIQIESVNLTKATFVIPSQPRITMNIGETKEVDVNNDGIGDMKINLKNINNGVVYYTMEKIEGGSKITGQTIIENFMDVSIKVSEDYKIINPNQNNKILVEITFLNLGTEEIKDTIFTYCVYNNNNLVGECIKETVTVQTKVQLIKRISLPSDIEEGTYSVIVKVDYNNETEESQDIFEVKNKQESKPRIYNFRITKSYLIIGLLGLISVLILILVLVFTIKRKIIHQKIKDIAYDLLHLRELKKKGEISEKTYDSERDRLLQRISGILNGKPMSIILLGIGTISFLGIFNFSKNITGYVIGESTQNSIATKLIYFISLIGAFSLLMFIHKQKLKKGVERIHEKVKKKYPTNSIKGLTNKKVYSECGDYIGQVKEIILGENKIDSWLIKLDQKIMKKIKKKDILVTHKHIIGIGHIIIIDNQVYTHLEKFKE